MLAPLSDLPSAWSVRNTRAKEGAGIWILQVPPEQVTVWIFLSPDSLPSDPKMSPKV